MNSQERATINWIVRLARNEIFGLRVGSNEPELVEYHADRLDKLMRDILEATSDPVEYVQAFVMEVKGRHELPC